MTPQVWLAAVRAGNGHLAARDSVALALSGVRHIKVTHETERLEQTHRRLVRWGDVALRAAWRFADSSLVTSGAPLLYPELRSDAERWLETANDDDVIVTTHFAQSLAVVAARNATRPSVRVISLLPDYTAAPASFRPPSKRHQADGYIVMADQVREQLIHDSGLEPERVYLSGTLVSETFTNARDAGIDAAWKRLDERCPSHRLRRELPTVIFLGGSGWTARTEPVLRAVLETTDQLNVIVVCGRDARFERCATELTRNAHALVVGFVEQSTLAAMMTVADMPVLGSAAPAMMHELLEVGCGPLCVFRLLGGSEDGHGDWLHQNGLGFFEPDAATMTKTVLELVHATHDFSRLARAARATQRRRAAGVAHFIQRTPRRVE